MRRAKKLKLAKLRTAQIQSLHLTAEIKIAEILG